MQSIDLRAICIHIDGFDISRKVDSCCLKATYPTYTTTSTASSVSHNTVADDGGRWREDVNRQGAGANMQKESV